MTIYIEYAEQIHKTWVSFMLEANFKEVAALGLDGEITCHKEDFDDILAYTIDLPPSAYNFVLMSEPVGMTMIQSLREVLKGRPGQEVEIVIRLKLLETEENWKELTRNLIAEAKSPNQGTITEKMFNRENKQPYLYNGVKYASKSEIRIAQEFEKRKVLFFPLALGIRNETGRQFLDQREVDFIVCVDGVWGIIEVSFHPDRFEKDAEKDAWFKKSGILCIQHYTAERCYNRPSDVVDEFLEILAKHKR
jgi:hypothetical protein